MTLTESLAVVNIVCALVVLVGRAAFDRKWERWALSSAIWGILYILKSI